MCPSISTQPVHSYLPKQFIYTYFSFHFYLLIHLNVRTPITSSPFISNYLTVHIYPTCQSVHTYSACLTLSTQLNYMYLLVHPYLPTYVSVHIYPPCPSISTKPIHLASHPSISAYLCVRPYLPASPFISTQAVYIYLLLYPFLPIHPSKCTYSYNYLSIHI